MNKHTSGPWIARNLFKGVWTVEAGSPHVHGKIQEVCRIAGPWNPENYKLNARLIASAPELLEALEACLPVIESECVALASVAGWDSTYDELHVKARILKDKASSAIAKARGL